MSKLESQTYAAKLSKVFFFTLLIIVYFSCTSEEDINLKKSLSLAGANKKELMKVLEHYKNDDQKLKAAKFLIANMYGFSSANKEIPIICNPFYTMYDSLAKKYNYEMNAERGKQIDSLWSNFYSQHPEIESLKDQPDLENISASYLISEIDLAFKAWKENIYTKDCSLDEFCEYILPYRRKNGLLIDDAKKVLYKRYGKEFFHSSGKNMINEADSLLYKCRYISHSQFWGTQIPILSASTFEYLQRGLCEQRCWYNTLLFSSLGMAAAVDFVPAWGNRNNNHSWNVLIKNGKSYAFESFWDQDRWKYKRIYNNKTFDYLWGEFKLPKVYRRTYKSNLEGPFVDKNVNPDDVPSLFKNIKIKDVSSEYFETKTVSLMLDKIPPKTRYAYLCVFGYGHWIPVQWGKITKNNVIFKDMGKDIVYLPAYFKDNEILPAGNPFLLNSNGEILSLNGNDGRLSVSINQTEDAASCYFYNRTNIYLLRGLQVFGKDPVKNTIDKLLTLPDTIPLKSVKYPFKYAKSLNEITVRFKTDTISVSEITFYDNLNQIVKPVRVETDMKFFDKGDSISYISDRITASGIKGLSKKREIHFFFKDNTIIAFIKIAPYIQNKVKNDGPFTLFYWADGNWQKAGLKKTDTNVLTFHDIPGNRLYLLQNMKHTKSSERIFLYENGEIIRH